MMTVQVVVLLLQLPSRLYHRRRSSPSKCLRQLRDLKTSISAYSRVIFYQQRSPSAILRLTVNARLERLPAHFARELAGARLLIHLDRDGFLMVAEQAWESGRERFLLETV